MDQKQYIQEVLVMEIGDIISNRHHWLSFLLVCSGIETLGALLDKDVLFKEGVSASRFNLAIDNLFPPLYKERNLYSSLRCGLNHVTVPKPNIGLTAREHHGQHLSINNGKISIVIEDFYEDFVKACNEVIKMTENGSIQEKIKLSTPSEKML